MAKKIVEVRSVPMRRDLTSMDFMPPRYRPEPEWRARIC